MSRSLRATALPALLLLGLSLAPAALSADDRQLLRTSSGAPYVFVLLDSSGSMNWSAPCSAEDYAAGLCNYLCPSSDCAVPRDGDDPASKMRQAKEALYEVIRDTDNVDFGFATYNQDALRVHWKEWLYRVQPVQADTNGFYTLAGGDLFPVAGTDEIFGATFTCDRNGGGNDGDDQDRGCYANQNAPADTNNLWEMTKVRRLAKLGDDKSADFVYFVRSGGRVYRVRVSNPTVAPGPTQQLGDAVLALRHRVYLCTGTPNDNPSNNCNDSAEYSLVADGDRVITYDLIGDFVKWDLGVRRAANQQGFDGVAQSNAGGTCNGWDPNTDDTTDQYNTYSLRYPDGAIYHDPAGTVNDFRYQYGDVVPLNWNSDNKTAILNRLAPRLAGGDPTLDPEAFANATYLNHHRIGTQDYLRLLTESERPIFPSGSTPLGATLSSFRTWFHGCNSTNCSGGAIGWKDVAATQDPDWECRKKYILLLTDGDETCGGTPGNVAGSLLDQDDVRTYVIGFGLPTGGGNTLDDIAFQGGTVAPILPTNRQALIDALNDILSEIQEETVAFASAAVPSVQADIADKIYLSSFTPLNLASVWPGRLDAFLKPLPLDGAGLPDRTEECLFGTVDGNCFAWDAGDSQPAWEGDASGLYQPRGLLLQAPTPTEIVTLDNTTLRIGNAEGERRVFFGLPTSTAVGRRQLFRYPTSPAEQLEFEFIWNLPPPLGSTANRDVIADVVEFTLAEKQAEITDPDTGIASRIQYVMGDIFHSNPLVINPPSSFEFYTQDLYWGQGLCGQNPTDTQNDRGARISYAWFANQHLCRRVMLAVGSNDGQFHIFDGGQFNLTEGGDPLDCKLDLPAALDARDANIGDLDTTSGKYDFGTGRELFAFVPAAQMPLVKELSETLQLTTQYGIDGSPRVADVFIDPQLDASGDPTCLQREWRTVVLGTYREGGSGLFALDVTQPDLIDTGNNVPDALAGSPKYVPSCIDGATGCGPVPFPSLLWEFQDTSDEDGVGGADLAESWSRPVVARIKVCEGACDQANEPEDRFVAIFGGGLPEAPVNNAADDSGNWIYMVDMETGRIVYKRGGDGYIVGAVAADVTLVDGNVNGLVDAYYFGTTAGFVYKLDLGEGPFELGVDGRIQDPTLEPGRYDPFQVFSTGGRPIQLEISAVYVPKLRRNALLFGTGNRWNLWEFNGQTARFYAIVDTGWSDLDRDGMIDSLAAVCSTCTQPLTELSIESIDPDSTFDINNPGPSYLFAPSTAGKLPGWFFPIGADQKLITEPFSLSGVTFFSFYDPVASEAAGVCALGGESNIFTVNTANAIGYAVDPATDERLRYTPTPAFTTQPFTEQSATTNEGNADPWTEDLTQINSDLKKLNPPGCRFGNYTIDIKTIRSDTGIVFIAPVPICIEGHNWKEY